MKQTQYTGLAFLALVCTSIFIPAYAAPPKHSQNHHHHQLTQQQQQQQQQYAEARKYVTKSNNIKKVYHKNMLNQVNTVDQQPPTIIEATNKISTEGGQGSNDGLPWTTIAGPMLQLVRMFFGVPNEMNANSLTQGMDKMDNNGLVTGGQGQFSWGQVIGYALKLLLATLGGGNGHDGIDKNDVVPSNPMQNIMKTLIGTLVGNEDGSGGADNMAKQTGEFINLAIALMNALKTSFSQRAMRARSLGEKDRMTDVTIAAIDMGKAYAKTFNTSNEECRRLHICQAARDCVADIGQANSYGLCHFTAYATANLMYYTQPGSSEDKIKSYMDSARKGRAMEDCKRAYFCNETP